MRILIAEDDFVCRKLIQKILEPFGECDIVVNGKEALEVFKQSVLDKAAYDLICLDIMMPEMDGLAALDSIRSFEKDHDIDLGEGVKVIMTTALSDNKHILQSFRNGCESYIIKPIKRDKLLLEMQKLGLISEMPS